MKRVLLKIAAPLLVFSMFAIGTAQAAITLYDTDGTSFNVDGFFNTFYVNSSSDNELAGTDRDQARIKMGFLPNYIGFNFSKQVNNLKLGGRSSFWVSINDSDDAAEKVTDTGIDVRQFYGTVDGAFGQILFGKDFGLYNRSNIFLDEILMGYGNVSDTLGLVDGGGVSFGNIGSGYIYPTPTAQITYRTPDMGGFKLALGLLDPSHTGAGVEESMPRIEGELTYNQSFEGGSMTAWANFMFQTSEAADGTDIDSEGIGYGLQAKFAGFSLTASGFDASGAGWLAGPGGDSALGLGVLNSDGDEMDSDGFLVQGSYTFGKARLVASYGKSEMDDHGFTGTDVEDETVTGAIFYALNSNLNLVAEYNVNTIELAGAGEEETKTIALGATLSF